MVASLSTAPWTINLCNLSGGQVCSVLLKRLNYVQLIFPYRNHQFLQKALVFISTFHSNSLHLSITCPSFPFGHPREAKKDMDTY